jgi:hypothetical protein
LGFAGFVVAAPLLGTLFKGLGKKERRQAQKTAGSGNGTSAF